MKPVSTDASQAGFKQRSLLPPHILAAVLSAFMLCSLSSTQATAEDRVCIIDKVSNGWAEILRGGDTIVDPQGQAIQQGDRLRKNRKSQISISCSDEGEITIGQDTEIDLDDLVKAPIGEPRVFRILRGISGFVMPGRAAPVQVKTLNAVASVRSTEWTVEVEGKMTHVFVRKGLVDVSAKNGQTAALSTGEGVTVMADGTMGPVESWGQSRITAMNGRLGGRWR
ncbi:hypothetical protein C1J03_03960 [Sulfitobacter sp. SK012]|uniref:FecR family protein n=1 Tax=Sulfitobacter sp. SK012 TaxID=1389005 RepID=UPI000E0BBF38|nr:FecR family protein [Sulfitobacter sp. SK012]AXI45262.1 hypothetical protein C1J03_03960 [Sulfitobacter sp. SK012]